MIVRTLEGLAGTERQTDAPTFVSRRFVLAREGVGFSFHDTVLYAGTSTEMWYRHHVESVYCVEGEGLLEDLETGESHEVRPGVHYLLDGHERHRLTARTDLRMMCVFIPALTGQEVHDSDGAYPPAEEEPAAS